MWQLGYWVGAGLGVLTGLVVACVWFVRWARNGFKW